MKPGTISLEKEVQYFARIRENMTKTKKLETWVNHFCREDDRAVW